MDGLVPVCGFCFASRLVYASTLAVGPLNFFYSIYLLKTSNNSQLQVESEIQD